MEHPPAALLLVADISGFTRFMRLHALASSHARQIVVRLLKALVGTARPPLRVAEIEGDAVFFYALAPEGDLSRTVEQTREQLLRFHQVFRAEIAALERVQACVCDACRNVGQLRLKQVVHTGSATLERIGRYEKLLGVDVIVVHRMLKNTVPSKEYLMMTDDAYRTFDGFYDLEPERRAEEFDGIGRVDTVVFYDTTLAAAMARLPRPAEPGTTRTVGWKLAMHARTLLALLGRTPPGGEVSLSLPPIAERQHPR